MSEMIDFLNEIIDVLFIEWKGLPLWLWAVIVLFIIALIGCATLEIIEEVLNYLHSLIPI